MGQAKLRGTKEQRQELAIARRREDERRREIQRQAEAKQLAEKRAKALQDFDAKKQRVLVGDSGRGLTHKTALMAALMGLSVGAVGGLAIAPTEEKPRRKR